MRDGGCPSSQCTPQWALILGAATPAQFEGLVRVKGQVSLEVTHRLLPCSGGVDLIALDNSRDSVRGVRVDRATQSIAGSGQRCSGGLLGTKLLSWSYSAGVAAMMFPP